MQSCMKCSNGPGRLSDLKYSARCESRLGLQHFHHQHLIKKHSFATSFLLLVCALHLPRPYLAALRLSSTPLRLPSAFRTPRLPKACQAALLLPHAWWLQPRRHPCIKQDMQLLSATAHACVFHESPMHATLRFNRAGSLPDQMTSESPSKHQHKLRSVAVAPEQLKALPYARQLAPSPPCIIQPLHHHDAIDHPSQGMSTHCLSGQLSTWQNFGPMALPAFKAPAGNAVCHYCQPELLSMHEWITCIIASSLLPRLPISTSQSSTPKQRLMSESAYPSHTCYTHQI